VDERVANVDAHTKRIRTIWQEPRNLDQAVETIQKYMKGMGDTLMLSSVPPAAFPDTPTPPSSSEPTYRLK